MDNGNKIIIYQVLPRLFGNNNPHCIQNGDIKVNGCGKLNDFTTKALLKIKTLGVTHIWYTGILEHATQTKYDEFSIPSSHPAIVKGKAGSPYAVRDYYDIDPDLAENVPQRMKEFESLISRTHATGLKAIMDFIPNHVARQYISDSQPFGVTSLGAQDRTDMAFRRDNNFYYIPQTELHAAFSLKGPANAPYNEMPAKATGNDRFDASPTITDWYETVKLNYGVDYLNGKQQYFSPIPNTWHKMLSILFFWTLKGVDGFRCDMAEMVPVEFWEWAIPQVKQVNSHVIFIAEVYDPTLYREYIHRGKFDYLYDKVGLYDTLRNIVVSGESAMLITKCWQNVNDIQCHMLNFLENHDEQRLASDFVTGDPKKCVPALVVSACMNTNPFMIYFGQELGEKGMDSEGYSGRDGRTTIFDYWALDSIRKWRNDGKYDDSLLTTEQKKLRAVYQKILTLCNAEPAIAKGMFFDLTYANENGWRFNEHRQFAFMRKHKNELIFIVVNFDGRPIRVAVNIPSHAFDHLQIPPCASYQAIDLLTNTTVPLGMVPYKPTEISLEGYGVRILKINTLQD